MKRFLPVILVLACLPIALLSQIAVDPVNYTMTGYASQSDIVHHVHITNTSQETISLHWSKRLKSGPVEWLTYICDPNACYEPETTSNPPQLPIVIEPGDIIDYQMHLKPRNTVGSGEYTANILDEEGNILQVITAQVEIGLTSTSSPAASNAKLFPNPATDFFQISGSEGLRFVEVYNILGSKIKTFDAGPQKQYFVGDLSEGVYLVRMLSTTGKVIKTVRLSVS